MGKSIMTEPVIEIRKLKAFAEIQKAGIDASVEYGTFTKDQAFQHKRTIDFLVKTVSDYAEFCNDLEQDEEDKK